LAIRDWNKGRGWKRSPGSPKEIVSLWGHKDPAEGRVLKVNIVVVVRRVVGILSRRVEQGG
jgi:hypothetical protein